METARMGIEKATHSDRMSNLPNDLLIRILSLIPVRNAMSTSLLSKRWKSVWKMMPTLDYDETCSHNGSLGFDQFCGTCLPLLEAPQVLKTLTLKLRKSSDSIDSLLFPNIPSTLLEITITSTSYPRHYSDIRFPHNLRVFQTLVVLKLHGNMLLDVVDSPVCFQSLKILHLRLVRFRDEESFCGLLSACPAIEDLLLERFVEGESFLFTISLLSLQRLFITRDVAYHYQDDPRFEINAPSLKYLHIVERGACFNFVDDMPNLVEAYVAVKDSLTEKFLRFFKPIEVLSIELYTSMLLPLAESISHRLLHLQLHVYNKVPRNLLLHLLKHSPKLKTLKLSEKHLRHTQEVKDEQHSICDPSSVPECVSLHLETFQWRGYEGTHEEVEVAAYILQNASCLKTASISIYAEGKGPRGGESDLIIIKELKSMCEASTSCQLVIQLDNFC